MFRHTKLSTYDVIIVQKSSNGEGKFTFNGWDNYFHRTLSLNLLYIYSVKTGTFKVGYFIFVWKMELFETAIDKVKHRWEIVRCKTC